MEVFDKRFDNRSQLIAHERKKLQQNQFLWQQSRLNR
jgi:hypothetical protein